jgi:hypothetical protein
MQTRKHDLPPRRLLPSGLSEDLDEDGFLTEQRYREGGTVEVLLTPGARVVLAARWYGKTWLAQQIQSVLRSRAHSTEAEPQFGDNYRVICFECFGRVTNPIPTWWDTWRDPVPNSAALADTT